MIMMDLTSETETNPPTLTQPFYIMKNEIKGKHVAAMLTRKERRELNEKDARQKWHLELMIAACLGAALALGFVVVHQMLNTQWTW